MFIKCFSSFVSAVGSNETFEKTVNEWLQVINRIAKVVDIFSTPQGIIVVYLAENPIEI